MSETIEALKVAEDTAAALQGIHQVMRAAYWERKDIGEVLSLGLAAIEHGMARAGAAGAEAADEILRWVKAIAYDVGSFTWRGWGEEGIEIDDDAARAGLDAARLNLRLAEMLDRSEEVRCAAHWLVGAHLLAVGSYDDAIAAFGEADAAATRAADPVQGHVQHGYIAIARLLQGIPDARDDLDAVEGALGATDDGVFWVEQLETALTALGGTR